MLSNCQGEESSVWLSFMLRYFCTPIFSLVERETSQYWLKYCLLTLMFVNKSLLLPSFILDSGACFSFPTFGSNVSFPCLRFSYVCPATLILELVTCLHDILAVGRVQFVFFEKINKCLFIPNCTRKIMWLRVNNIHGKIQDGLS